MSPAVPVGVLTLSVLLGTWALLAPRPSQAVAARLRPAAEPEPGWLTRSTTVATGLLDRLIQRRGGEDAVAGLLERAGLQVRVQDLALMVIGGTLGGAAVGGVLGGFPLAVLLGLTVAVGARVYLWRRVKVRQRDFADQIDDSLQLLASSLRAGHSLLQALKSVSVEAEEPTAAEFSRIINETRVGRPLADALDETAERMASDDFRWVGQAIGINREVGGNLADVLDGIGHTIRERNQIRRQVQALSAEGKLSAYVLLALPVGITMFLAVTNGSYIGKFLQHPIGYVLIVVAIVMMTVGTLWMRKVVSFRF